jgi:hypothetical protein
LSDNRLRIATEEDRDRLHAARQRAESCGACGRPLGAADTVYIERFSVVRSSLQGPVGRECASPELLARTRGVEPERCIGCGRRIYYGAERPTRRKAACSHRCRVRAWRSEHRKGVE